MSQAMESLRESQATERQMKEEEESQRAKATTTTTTTMDSHSLLEGRKVKNWNLF